MQTDVVIVVGNVFHEFAHKAGAVTAGEVEALHGFAEEGLLVGHGFPWYIYAVRRIIHTASTSSNVRAV